MDNAEKLLKEVAEFIETRIGSDTGFFMAALSFGEAGFGNGMITNMSEKDVASLAQDVIEAQKNDDCKSDVEIIGTPGNKPNGHAH